MTLEKFHYRIGDTEITLPPISNLPLGIIRKTRKADDAERLFVIFEHFFAEGSPELDAIDSLDAEGVASLMAAWQEHGGISVGESSAS